MATKLQLEKLDKYAKLKQDIVILEMQLDALKPDILKILEKNENKAMLPYGTFSRVPRIVKKYSESMATRIDMLKNALKFDIEKLEEKYPNEVTTEAKFDVRFLSKKG